MIGHGSPVMLECDGRLSRLKPAHCEHLILAIPFASLEHLWSVARPFDDQWWRNCWRCLVDNRLETVRRIADVVLTTIDWRQCDVFRSGSDTILWSGWYHVWLNRSNLHFPQTGPMHRAILYGDWTNMELNLVIPLVSQREGRTIMQNTRRFSWNTQISGKTIEKEESYSTTRGLVYYNVAHALFYLNRRWLRGWRWRITTVSLSQLRLSFLICGTYEFFSRCVGVNELCSVFESESSLCRCLVWFIHRVFIGCSCCPKSGPRSYLSQAGPISRCNHPCF